MVYVRLYSTLTKYLKGTRVGEAAPVDLAAGASVRDLVRKLGIARTEVFLVSVNGQIQSDAYVLRDGDEVSLFGPIAGGDGILNGPSFSCPLRGTTAGENSAPKGWNGRPARSHRPEACATRSLFSQE